MLFLSPAALTDAVKLPICPPHLDEIAVIHVRHPVNFVRKLFQFSRHPIPVSLMHLFVGEPNLLFKQGRLYEAASEFFATLSGCWAT